MRATYAKFIFPGLLVLCFISLVALGINGSSVGIYGQQLASKGNIDKNLLFGVPQPVRGDEWNVITPMTVSQHRAGYPVINRDIGNGQDMTVILDAPVKDWSTLLRPWNWGFFFLSLNNAFAFKWWAMLVGLGMAAYLLILKLFPRRYLLASLGAVFLMASPFVQWWYREYTLGLLAFGLGGLVTMLSLHQTERRRNKLLLTGLLAYLLAGFAFIQYPPFEILAAIAISLFYLGFLANLLAGSGRAKRLATLKDFGLVVSAAAVAAGVMAIFYTQHASALKALQDTVYPGQRSYPSGQGGVLLLAHLLSSDLMPFLQKHTAAVQSFYYNQSEASIFIQYSLVLLIPMAAIIIKRVKDNRPINWMLVTLSIGMLLAYVYLFIPGVTILFKPLLFSKIPPGRFEMLIGLIDFFSLLVIAKEFPETFAKRKPRYMLSILTGLVALAVFVVTDFYLNSLFPGLLNLELAILAAVWLAAALTLVMIGKKEFGMAMLVVFSVACVFRVNPLYKGLGVLAETPLARYIQTASKQRPQARWITTERLFEGYLPANGARSLTGDYSYPQTKLWQSIDDSPAAYQAYDRAVHAEAVIDNRNYIELHNTNTMYLHLNSCSPLMKRLNIKYLVTENTYPGDRCLKLQDSFPINDATANVYEVNP